MDFDERDALEVGSEFHWMSLPDEEKLPWASPAAWFALGRHAVTALAVELGARTLWVPEYFCHDVAGAWGASLDVRFYVDDPRRKEPVFASLVPAPRDLVIAVNYFGVRDGAPWNAWRRDHECVLLEDHSHDPFSPWARGSRAEFAFASVRKTVPVPDGAILWSPLARRLPAPPPAEDWTGSALKLAAEIWKADYLAGKGLIDAKAVFRELQSRGERRLEDAAPSAVSPWSARYLAAGVPAVWRDRRLENTRRLLARLDGWRAALPLFRDWPVGAVPFAAVLVFPAREARDACRAQLNSHDVYCPIHWEAPGWTSQAVRDLASSALTVPTDHRYSPDDMARVADILTAG